MKKTFLFYALVALILAGCSKEEDQTTDSTKPYGSIALTGSWTWVKSSGMGLTITPESSGKTMTIEFMEGEVFNKFVDGEMVYTSPYIIQEADGIIGYTTLALFKSIGLGFDHPVEQQIKFTDSKNLLLIDPRCNNCNNFTFEFSRKL